MSLDGREALVLNEIREHNLIALPLKLNKANKNKYKFDKFSPINFAKFRFVKFKVKCEVDSP